MFIKIMKVENRVNCDFSSLWVGLSNILFKNEDARTEIFTQDEALL